MLLSQNVWTFFCFIRNIEQKSCFHINIRWNRRHRFELKTFESSMWRKILKNVLLSILMSKRVASTSKLSSKIVKTKCCFKTKRSTESCIEPQTWIKSFFTAICLELPAINNIRNKRSLVNRIIVLKLHHFNRKIGWCIFEFKSILQNWQIKHLQPNCYFLTYQNWSQVINSCFTYVWTITLHWSTNLNKIVLN